MRPATATRSVPSQKAPLAAQASTTVGRGNPEIMETLPNTAEELDIVVEDPPSSMPSESIPSSSALQQDIPASPFAELSEQTNGFDNTATDWSKSYHGLSQQPFPKEVADVLLAPIDENDVEIKPGVLIFYYSIDRRF